MSIKGVVLGAGAIVLIATLATVIGDALDLPAASSDPTVLEQTPTTPTSQAANPPEPEARSSRGLEAAQIPAVEKAASAAGPPPRVARQFALAWINRPTRPERLARQGRRLVSLAYGFFADQLAANAGQGIGTGSRGSVVGVQEIAGGRDGAVLLVTTREQLAPQGRPREPFHYGLYLARLERVAGGFAVSSWEPQF